MSRNNSIDEIKSRCDIVEIIGQVVALKKSGSNHMGLCPFHNEKTPSFAVSESKQIFTCFGCMASGDVIEFVKRYYNLEFVEALEKLAGICGVTLERGYGQNRLSSEERERMYSINKEAAKFYFANMRKRKNTAMDYMTSRGISREILNKFGIGYTGTDGRGLYKYLTELGYDEDILMKLGLISKSEDRCFDKFRNRVIFPIQDKTKRVIGFGGRIIGDGMPKYLNTSETPIFHKKNNLYGLFLTGRNIEKEKKSILVEGYMDVISLYQNGIENCVATLGTALTSEQAKLIKRYSKNVVIAYDGDAAGIAATMRGMDILQRTGCRVKVLTIAEGKDPDDYVRARGKLAFEKAVDQALPLVDYKLEFLAKRFEMDDREEKIEFLKKAVDVLKNLSPIEADIYVNLLSTKYEISKMAIEAELAKHKGENNSVGGDHGPAEAVSEISLVEQHLIKTIMMNSKLLEKKEDIKGLMVSNIGKNIVETMMRCRDLEGDISIESLEGMLDLDEERVLAHIDSCLVPSSSSEQMYDDCIKKLKMMGLQREERMLLDRISVAEQVGKEEDIRSLTEELMEVQSEIRLRRN